MDAVEDLVGRVVDADDPDEDDGPGLVEDYVLPRATELVVPVDGHLPVAVVEARLDVVRVAAVVAVPEQEPHRRYPVRLGELDHDRGATWARDEGTTSVT